MSCSGLFINTVRNTIYVPQGFPRSNGGRKYCEHRLSPIGGRKPGIDKE